MVRWQADQGCLAADRTPRPGQPPLAGRVKLGDKAHAGTGRMSGPLRKLQGMDWKIELVAIPVTDVDRAKAFYVDQVGFHADHDHQVNESLRFVQLTPPGSACSVVLGTGITDMPPGSQKGIQIVVDDAAAARST